MWRNAQKEFADYAKLFGVAEDKSSGGSEDGESVEDPVEAAIYKNNWRRQLMSKIFELESDYREIKAVNSSGSTLTAGSYFASGNVAGFSLVDVVAGAVFALVVAASKVKVVKNAGEAWAAGERLYYDESESEVTNVATDNILIGHAAEAATSAAVEGWVDFNGELKSINELITAV